MLRVKLRSSAALQEPAEFLIRNLVVAPTILNLAEASNLLNFCAYKPQWCTAVKTFCDLEKCMLL